MSYALPARPCRTESYLSAPSRACRAFRARPDQSRPVHVPPCHVMACLVWPALPDQTEPNRAEPDLACRAKSSPRQTPPGSATPGRAEPGHAQPRQAAPSPRPAPPDFALSAEPDHSNRDPTYPCHVMPASPRLVRPLHVASGLAMQQLTPHRPSPAPVSRFARRSFAPSRHHPRARKTGRVPELVRARDRRARIHSTALRRRALSRCAVA